jgi:hypothetical protein
MKIFSFTAKTVSWMIALAVSVCMSVASAGSLIATWTPNSEPDLAGYIVYYGTESGNCTNEVDVKNTTTFMASDLIDGQEYFFAVKAYDYSGNKSSLSAEVSATVGGPMLAVLKDQNSLRLVWTPVTGADSYKIYRSTDPYFTPTTPIQTVSASEHEFADAHHFSNNSEQTYYTAQAMQGSSVLHQYETVGAFDIKLQAGLNLVSLPLEPADPSLHATFRDQLTGGQSSADADQLRFWNGEEYNVAWLFEGNVAEFNGKWIGASTGQEAQLSLDPNSAFWVMIQNNHPETSLTMTGRVPTALERTIVLEKGHNFVGSVYPVPVSLNKTELYEDGVMVGGVGSGEADILQAWNGQGYERTWVVDGVNEEMDGTWMDETGKDETTLSFEPGNGYIIWIKQDNPKTPWTFPNPALAE